MSEETWRWRVLRWTVPVDDHHHEIGGGKVLLIECRRAGQVEVWTEEYCNQDFKTTVPKRTVQVIGTGQPFGDSLDEHIGSTLDGPLVWHVYALEDES